MYKLIIVDDEEEVRRGIIETIKWDKFGFEIVGEAENGREALELIEENTPDVIITDISMPLMDGLQLAAAVQDEYPTVKIVILTGFDDFKFAQQAIKYGVIDYILKPILPKEISELMQKLKKQIDSEIEEKNDKEKLKQHYYESMPVLKENFLMSLVSGRQGKDEAERKISDFDLRIKGSCFAAAALSIDSGSSQDMWDDSDTELMKFAVFNIAQEILDKRGNGEVFFFDNAPVIIAGVESTDKSAAFRKVFSLLEEIRQSVEKYLKFTVVIGLGSIYDSVERIAHSFESAVTALEYRLVLGGNKVIFADDLEPEITDTIVFDENKERRLISSIKFGEKKDVFEAVALLFHDVGKKASIKGFQLYFLEILAAISKLARVFQIDVTEILPHGSGFYADISRFETTDEMKEWIETLCSKLMDIISAKRVNTIQTMLEKAKDFIDENFDDHELSLQKLADVLFISPSYLSLIFKNEAGETFLKYLIRVRLEAAKELLNAPDVKITEVAERVGYPDISYFSYFFKKNFGVSPREYRSKRIDAKGC